ncbi:MAG: ATP12 family protein [Pseudomonadota bacterium]
MKRFWRETAWQKVDDGYELTLDGKPIRTPGRQPLLLPTVELAEAMAAEWEAQVERVDPGAMPLTRAANTAIDRVMVHRAPVVAELARYGETDLLCYRAPHPPGLVVRQAALWDPLLDWAETAFGARLVPAEGVIYAAQNETALSRLREELEKADVWALTALHELVSLSGSLVIGLGVKHGRLSTADAWAASRVDEDWNIAEWVEDEEAAAQAARREAAFHAAARFLALSSSA